MATESVSSPACNARHSVIRCMKVRNKQTKKCIRAYTAADVRLASAVIRTKFYVFQLRVYLHFYYLCIVPRLYSFLYIEANSCVASSIFIYIYALLLIFPLFFVARSVVHKFHVLPNVKIIHTHPFGFLQKQTAARATNRVNEKSREMNFRVRLLCNIFYLHPHSAAINNRRSRTNAKTSHEGFLLLCQAFERQGSM